jgi:hypothetical protein
MGLTAAQIKKVGSNSISMAVGTTPFTNFQECSPRALAPH